MVKDFTSDPSKVLNIIKLMRKDPITVADPNIPAIDLGITLNPNPFIRNPISGNNGTNQTKSIDFMCHGHWQL